VTYKKGGSRKKRLACAHKSELFCFFSHSNFFSLLVSHERVSRFFRCAVLAAVETAGGIRKGAQAAPGLKPLFPRYLNGAYAGRCSVGYSIKAAAF
jgi:hypothetical protein